MAVDQRIESFLTDVLALAGEDFDAIRKGVRVALADCEAIFRTEEVNTRMRDRAYLLDDASTAQHAASVSATQGNANRGASNGLDCY
jgi:hypothetical protein